MKKADLEDLEKELWLRLRNTNKIVWVTKEGVKIPINEMTTQHLVNALNYFYKNDNSDDWPWTEFGPGDADNMF